MMIDQVMALHPGIRWFHVGADDVLLLYGIIKNIFTFELLQIVI